MFSTCIFCHASLGANESIEHFPIGRRLAFDASRGRLWAVCRQCERWNLSPLEERWEAIEECERLFGVTKTRMSTDNIGMARVREGLELVRIGAPQRPEMAAWRYGDQFGRRRTKHLIYTGAAITAAVGLIALGPVTGIVAGGSWAVYNAAGIAKMAYQQGRVRARFVLPHHNRAIRLRLSKLNQVSLVQAGGEWALRVPFEAGGTRPAMSVLSRLPFMSRWEEMEESSAIVTGDDALHVAAKLLPALNAAGAKRTDVQSAVELIGRSVEPSKLFERYASQPAVRGRPWTPSDVPGQVISKLPREVRLALEMATHEDSERRALEGELAILEGAWREAEEIAAIADDMFVSDADRLRIAELKRAGHRGDRDDSA